MIKEIFDAANETIIKEDIHIFFSGTLFFSKNITALLLNMVVNNNIPKRKTTRLLAIFRSVHGLRSSCDKHL